MKVRHMFTSGQPEDGLRYAKRIHKYFSAVFAITWILSCFIGVCEPSYIAYRSRGYDAMAKKDLKCFYIAAERYFETNPNGTFDVETAKQYCFKPTYDVKSEVRRGQQVNFLATASHPKGTRMFIINNKGEITEQKMPDR